MKRPEPPRRQPSPADDERAEVPESHREELDRRLESGDDGATTSWAAAKARILAAGLGHGSP